MSEKKKTVHQKFDEIERKIELRPTHFQSIGYYLGIVGILSTIFYFVFNAVLDTKLEAQSKCIKAETTVAVVEAVQRHEHNEYARWDDRKREIIQEVLSKLRLIK